MSDRAAHLYLGSVSHTRLRPCVHRLRYSMFQMLVDIDAAPRLARSLRFFSHNRFNVFSFHDADHGDGQAGPLRAWVDETLAKAGIHLAGGEVRLLAMPRILGHVFNPLSLYFCRRADGELAAVIHEVNNTFGERHAYVIAAREEGGRIRQSCTKRFHVSPFMDMAMTYEFNLTTPAETITVAVNARDETGKTVIAARFSAQRREFTDAVLFKTFTAHPLLTLKVVGAIHFEAARLLLKGLRMRRRPPPPSEPVTVVA